MNNLLKPYLPFSSCKVEQYLQEYNDEWEYKKISKVNIINNVDILYERYDKTIIDEELNILKK